MIKLTDDRRRVGGVALGGIWIGDSGDEYAADLTTAGVGAILNVAQDMTSSRGWWHGIEAMHVGLIDGPGNEPAAYCAAVLALHALLRRHNTLVCCHSGGRALAVAVMYVSIGSDRLWGDCLNILRERVDVDLPVPNDVHCNAFYEIDWRPLRALVGT